MQRAVLYSFALHLAVLLALVVGLPSLTERREIAPPIPVQLVKLSELDKPSPPKPKPKPAKVEKPKPPEPEPPKQESKLPEPAPAPEPAPKVEPKPEPEAVVPPPEPEPKPTAPETKPELAEESPPPPPTPKVKPQIKVATPEPPKEEKPPDDRLTTILRNVDKLRERQSAAAEPEATPEEAEPQPRGSRIQQMNLARSIQQQMSRCWRIEPGARDAEDLVIEVRVALRRDGRVGKVHIVDQARFSRDAFFRSAAENARRAIYECQPFALPLKDYEVWREMRLTFDPKFMFGG